MCTKKETIVIKLHRDLDVEKRKDHYNLVKKGETVKKRSGDNKKESTLQCKKEKYVKN